jgi:hypothetical protein
MSRWSSPRRERVAGARLLLALSTALACAASQPNEALVPVQPAAPPVASESPVETPRSAPAPADEAPASNATVESVVGLIAKPNLWPLDIESARRILSALGPVTREQPTASHVSLVGGPVGPLARYEVAYSLDAQQYWAFGSAGFVLADRDLPRLYRTLETRLTQLLGKPARSAAVKAGALPMTAWDLGDAILLSLAPSGKTGECRVLIASSGRAIEPEEVDEEDTGLIQ